jgi:succinylarginine dihydrolase
MSKASEVNFDGLVGPTHNYAGLAYGNIASMKHAMTPANPQAAVLEGLEKMKLLSDLGVAQGVFPPHERPHMESLRRLGFDGSDSRILEHVSKQAPDLLAASYSASAMWVANAATVSPSADSSDGLVHFTPANLISLFHRSIETQFTQRLLDAVFRDPTAFVHHPPLPATDQFSDEGAANHVRLCRRHHERGIELFVYGRKASEDSGQSLEAFPQRQTYEASLAIARLHKLEPRRTVFACQSPLAINAGVFHNDVISVGNQNVLLFHSQAFSDSQAVVDELKQKSWERCRTELILIEVDPEQVSPEEAVATYLFNSQLVTLPDGSMRMVAPGECMENVNTRTLLESLVADSTNPIGAVHYVNIRQSMKNGGGPACLRLRVVLTDKERGLSHQGIYLTPNLYHDLKDWACRHYRDRLLPEDLADSRLIDENRAALDELTQILRLGSIYDFQKL